MSDRPAPDRHLFLIGLRASGKSTVGRLLAQKSGLPFFDVDIEVESHARRPIRDIFARDGEAAFRDMEADMLASLASGAPSVIATGGGVILREENRKLMRAAGRTVWLTASVGEMCRRLLNDSTTILRRPDLSVGGRAEVEQLLAARESLYRECADLIVDTEGRSPGDVAETILLSWSTS